MPHQMLTIEGAKQTLEQRLEAVPQIPTTKLRFGRNRGAKLHQVSKPFHM